MIFSIMTSIFLILAVICLMKLTPAQVTNDLMKIITPNDCLRDKIRNLRGNKKKHPLYRRLNQMKAALASTGKAKQFTVVCAVSLILFAVGVILSVIINNLFLLPVISVTMALLPFFYVSNTLSFYYKHTKEELETTLSIITNSYLRSDDILAAVNENVSYIRPPLREVFQAFIGDAMAVSSDIKHSLLNLKDKIDDEIFNEWCDTLIQCQDDRTLKDTLQPIVAKLTDIRIVNSELKTMLSAAKNEYWMMVGLVLINIPLLYFLNKDWFETLLFSTPGKIVLGIGGTVILITALFMMKFTKPIEYKR